MFFPPQPSLSDRTGRQYHFPWPNSPVGLYKFYRNHGACPEKR